MRKKIFYINHGSARGGATLSLLYMLQSLDGAKFDPIICGSEDDPENVELFSRYGFRTCSCKLLTFNNTITAHYSLTKIDGWRRFIKWRCDYKAACRRLANLLVAVRPDLVHLNSLTLAPYAHVPFLMGIPTVVHVREPIFDDMFRLRKGWLLRHLNQFASKVVCICRDNANRLGLSPDKIEIIYNPVDFRKFDYNIRQGDARMELGIPFDSKVVLFASGSTPAAKGLYPFLASAERLLQFDSRLICLMPAFEFPPDHQKRVWTLRRRVGKVLGIYKESDKLDKLIRLRGLCNHIVSGPFIYNIERWIAASDVVCAPHIQPHFSRTILEAGAMKKPVVASRIGGIEEVVADGATGLLVKAGDVKGLARAIAKLFSDKPLCEKLGAGGYAQAKNLSDTQKCAMKIAELYEKLFV